VKKSLKIGPCLGKSWARVWCFVFLTHSVELHALLIDWLTALLTYWRCDVTRRLQLKFATRRRSPMTSRARSRQSRSTWSTSTNLTQFITHSIALQHRVDGGAKVCRYNCFLDWPFLVLKYKYFPEIKYTKAVLSETVTWFQITKMLIAAVNK